MKVDAGGITENQDFMMNNNDVSFVKGGLVAIYNPSESVRLDVRVNNDTVWLTQNQMGILFGVDRTVIVRHIGNIYKSGELSEESTCAKNAQVQNEGGRSVRRIQKYYNTKAIDRQLRLDLQRHNEQSSPIEIRIFGKAHDRFLIIDDSVYHIGASLKDLGKKWFAFSLMRDLDPQELIQKISADPQSGR